MSGYIVGIIIFLGLLGAVLWKLNIWPFKKKYVYRQDILPVKWPERFANYYYTPEGINCNFEDPMTQAEFDRIAPVIDMGARNCIRGYLPQWTKATSPSAFRIGFIKPTATNMDGSPALTVGGVQTAGTVIGVNASFSPLMIVLPQQKNWEYLSYLMYSVWHEAEHFGEFENDKGWFWNYVGAGDVHPHRSIENPELPPAPVGLVGRTESVAVCNSSFNHLKG